MKFLSIATNIGLTFSRMMGISTPANIFAAGSNNQIQSPNNFFETIWAIITKTFEKLLTSAFEIIIKFVYSIIRWILTAVDFLFVLIRQIIGLNTDFNDVESLTSSDLIFKFIFNDTVINVIKGMIGFGLLLIIIFSIFAIVKAEYNYIAHGGDNSKKQILSNALKSLFLMVLVPVLFIGGIILSNAIARSLYIATSGGTDTSLGAQIFVTSGYDANIFRDYANKNLKIPITFNFNEVNKETDNITGWGSDGEIAELDQALQDFKNSSVWNRGFTTFLMFYIDTFLPMNQVDSIEWGSNGSQIIKNNSFNSYYDKNIYTTRDQYYVMADFIDSAIKSESKFYYKTIEQVYNSYNALPNDLKSKVGDLNHNKIYFENDEYCINVSYRDFNYSTTKIVHTKGATSESDGAVFILATEKLVEDESGNIYSCYYPFFTSDFGTSYQGGGECVVARGLFSDDGYPTAIKQEDGVVKFYREDLNIPTILDFFPTISYEKPEGVTNLPGLELIKKGMSGITGVDVSQFIPYIYFSFDIFSLFTKASYDIVTLEDGYLRLDYNFSQDGYVITNVYNVMNLNIVVMIFAGGIIIGMLIKIIFGLAHRIMDVTLLAITYPAVISTYPLDNGERFKGWVDMVLKKILSIYGLVIGINLVLWMFPILDELDLFSPAIITQSILEGLLSNRLGVGFLNLITELLFMLVAFTLLESATKTFEELITGSDTSKSGIIADGTKTVSDLAALPKKIGNVVSGQIILDAGKEVFKTATSFVPGSAFIADRIENKKEYKAVDDADTKIQNYWNQIRSAGNPPDGVNPPPDGGNPPPDGGNPPPDSGNPPSDSGNPPPDGSNPPPDSGNPPPDSVNPPPEGGDTSILENSVNPPPEGGDTSISGDGGDETGGVDPSISEDGRNQTPSSGNGDKVAEDVKTDMAVDYMSKTVPGFSALPNGMKKVVAQEALKEEGGTSKQDDDIALSIGAMTGNPKAIKKLKEDGKEETKEDLKDFSRKVLGNSEQEKTKNDDNSNDEKNEVQEEIPAAQDEAVGKENADGGDETPSQEDQDIKERESEEDDSYKESSKDKESNPETKSGDEDSDATNDNDTGDSNESKIESQQESEGEDASTTQNDSVDDNEVTQEANDVEDDSSETSTENSNEDGANSDTAESKTESTNESETVTDGVENSAAVGTETTSATEKTETSETSDTTKTEDEDSINEQFEGSGEANSNIEQPDTPDEQNDSSRGEQESTDETETKKEVDPEDLEKQRKKKLARKFKISEPVLQQGLDYSKVYDDEYQAYLKKTGKQDSDEEKYNFFKQQQDEAKATSQDANQAFEDKTYVANLLAQAEEHPNHFARVRENEYHKYLEENNAQDSQMERAKFYVGASRKSNASEEEKENFYRDSMIANYSSGENRATVNKFVNYKKDDYNKFMAESGLQDSTITRARFYRNFAETAPRRFGDNDISVMDSYNHEANLKYAQDLRTNGMKKKDFDKTIMAPDDPNINS